MPQQDKNNQDFNRRKKQDALPATIIVILILLIMIIGFYRMMSQSNSIKIKEVKRQIPEVKQQLLPQKPKT